MKAATKRNLNFAFILGTLLLTLVIGISNNELTNVWQALRTLSFQWLLACLGAWIVYLALDGLIIYNFLRRQNYSITYKYALYVALMGIYYSNVTPGATGGQPMQVYYLKKRSVPIGIGSSALTVKFFCFQFMLLVIGGIFWITYAGFVSEQLQTAKVFLIGGYVFNSFSVGLVLLMAVNKRIVRFFIYLFIKLGTKMHICKDPIQSTTKWEGILSTFHSSVMLIRKRPGELMGMLLLSGLQVLSLMAVTVFVYHAFGLSGINAVRIITMALLLYISASYTPLPGASGAQEGGFMLYFKFIFPQAQIFLGLLIWRFFTFYLSLLAGAGVTVAQSTKSILESRKKEKADDT